MHPVSRRGRHANRHASAPRASQFAVSAFLTRRVLSIGHVKTSTRASVKIRTRGDPTARRHPSPGEPMISGCSWSKPARQNRQTETDPFRPSDRRPTPESTVGAQVARRRSASPRRSAVARTRAGQAARPLALARSRPTSCRPPWSHAWSAGGRNETPGQRGRAAIRARPGCQGPSAPGRRAGTR